MIPTAGGKARKICRGGKLLAWAPDGRYVLFEKEKSDPPEVWRIPAEGGKAEKLLEWKVPLGGSLWGWEMRLHPNGRRVAYTKQSGERARVEVWAIDNFLPGFTASR